MSTNLIPIAVPGASPIMAAQQDGKEWATNFEAPSRAFEEDAKEIWSYPKEYIQKVFAETPRDCHFDRPYVK